MDASGESAPVFHTHIQRKVIRSPPTNTPQGRLQIKTIAQEFLQAWITQSHAIAEAETKPA